MKIDVEGAEEFALRGLGTLLGKGLVDQFVIEVHDLNGALERLKSMFKDAGYDTFVEQEKWEIHKVMKIFTLFARKKNLDY